MELGGWCGGTMSFRSTVNDGVKRVAARFRRRMAQGITVSADGERRLSSKLELSNR